MPKLLLLSRDGARAEVYLHGAHVTSWTPAAETQDRLFLSARSHFRDGQEIRGGVPVCFPQFATQGPLPLHGFARTTAWNPVEAGLRSDNAAQAFLRLADSDVTRALWPHAFVVELQVTVTGKTLALGFTVRNTGETAFEFTGALHTYLRCIDLPHTTVHGFESARYRDKFLGQDDCIETAPALLIDRPLDRVYYRAPVNLEVREPGRIMSIRTSGFPDTVIWNPGAERGATLDDLEPDGYSRMLCVEAAAAQYPVVVQPGVRWRGSQTLIAR